MPLVLTRAQGESVYISTGAGELITVKVLDFGRSEVRLMFDAPSTVGIVREEITPRKDNHAKPIRRGINRNDLGGN